MCELIKRAFLVIFIFCSLSLANVLAAENNQMVSGIADQEKVDDSLYIYDVKIESQKDNKIDVFFTLENKAKTKLNLHYNLSLVRADGSGPIERFFSANENKVFSVSPYEKISERLKFDAPDFYRGNYRVVVRIGSVSGLSYMGISENEVFLDGSGEFIDLSDCRVVVDTESDKDYDLQFGLVIKKGELGYVNCLAKNNSKEELKVNGSQDVYLRDEFSDFLKVVPDESAIYFLPGEEKNVTLPILGIDNLNPQAYTNVLNLLADGAVISNDIYIHYVVSGLSGSINKALLDKDYYQKDDTALLELGITDRADIYNGSRYLEKESDKGILKISMFDKEGESCTEEDVNLNDLKILDNNYHFSLKIQKECIDPSLKLNLTDKNGKDLAHLEAKIQSKNVPSGAIGVENDNLLSNSFSVRNILLILAGLLLVVVLIILMRKKK